ncbi:MAG: hypothetical protein AB1726_11705, partial [Planctomycetota bacterium]
GRRALAALVVLAVAAAVLAPAVRQRRYLFSLSPAAAVRETFLYNPFPEAVEVAEIVAACSTPGDALAVLGSEPELYFYTGRRPATGHIYMYPLMERQPYAGRMQAEMIREIEASEPEILVQVNVAWSWLRQPDSDTSLLAWFQQYARGYDTVGMVEIRREGTDVYTDLAAQRRPKPPDQFWIAVLKRRP